MLAVWIYRLRRWSEDSLIRAVTKSRGCRRLRDGHRELWRGANRSLCIWQTQDCFGQTVRDKLSLSIEVSLCHRIALHPIQREISKRLVSEESLTWFVKEEAVHIPWGTWGSHRTTCGTWALLSLHECQGSNSSHPAWPLLTHLLASEESSYPMPKKPNKTFQMQRGSAFDLGDHLWRVEAGAELFCWDNWEWSLCSCGNWILVVPIKSECIWYKKALQCCLCIGRTFYTREKG